MDISCLSPDTGPGPTYNPQNRLLPSAEQAPPLAGSLRSGFLLLHNVLGRTLQLTQKSPAGRGIITTWKVGRVIKADGSGGQELKLFHVTSIGTQEKHETIVPKSHGYGGNSGQRCKVLGKGFSSGPNVWFCPSLGNYWAWAKRRRWRVHVFPIFRMKPWMWTCPFDLLLMTTCVRSVLITSRRASGKHQAHSAGSRPSL